MAATERCALCGCALHRTAGTYALPTVQGRSHATAHHCVAERFFGRSKTRDGQRERTFETCPWGVEGVTLVFCYECHEELLHNPVFLPKDIDRLARLCSERGYGEVVKTDDRDRLAGRIKLLHDVIDTGLSALEEARVPPRSSGSPDSQGEQS
jgi:hypothetical protein